MKKMKYQEKMGKLDKNIEDVKRYKVKIVQNGMEAVP